MTDRIIERRDVNGNFSIYRFDIRGIEYWANVHGTDVWDIRRTVHRKRRGVVVGSKAVNVKSAALEKHLRKMLEADELAAMNDEA